MKKVLVALSILMIAAVACRPAAIPTTTEPAGKSAVSAEAEGQSSEITATDVKASLTPSATATLTPVPTPTQLPTPTPLPPFVQPPTPAPPANEWIEYRYNDDVSFRYPANWFVYEENATITVTNFRLDSLLKGHTEEKVKIDILITPRDISAYPALEAYLDTQEETNASENKDILSQVTLPHEVEGYEVVRQTVSGLMGNPAATYERIYVASEGKVIVTMMYGEKYVDVLDRIAGTLEW